MEHKTLYEINAGSFIDLLEAGIANLCYERDRINDLNVFPVPDGDTGTNMTVTLSNALASLKDEIDLDLDTLSRKFAYNVVLGARGNSGVIVSQFMRGIFLTFFDRETADPSLLVKALESGVECAYRSVAEPVEGTMLTVMREASHYVSLEYEKGNVTSVNNVINAFLKEAAASLERTPELLPILKKAGVVDSGGAGIIALFDGMRKYLENEPIAPASPSSISTTPVIDYSRFTKSSEFPFGYCTECLLQLTDEKTDISSFDLDEFTVELCSIGSSAAVSREGDKIKIHVHTHTPEEALSFCHKYGEFLTLKIENMSVQHDGVEVKAQSSRGISSFSAYTDQSIDAHKPICTIAVSPDGTMNSVFSSLGVDYIISSDKNCAPSTEDFIRAFDSLDCDHIIVFPNEKSNMLALEASASLCEKDNIHIMNSKNPAECYAALTMLDCESEDIDGVLRLLDDTIENVTVLTAAKATRDTDFGEDHIKQGDFISVLDNRLISYGDDLSAVLFEGISKILKEEDKEVVTFFASPSYCRHAIKASQKKLSETNLYIESGIIDLDKESETIYISFE